MNSESVLYTIENGMYREITKEQVIMELLEANKSLEKRINKAIEILNMPQFEDDNIPCNYENEIEELRNILRGDE